MSYHTILVPYDGSAFSNKALEHAVNIAKNYNSAIYLYTVVSSGAIIPPGSLLGLTRNTTKDKIKQKLVKSLKEETEKELSKKVEQCERKGVTAQYIISAGDNVAEEILKAAKKKNVDLIVIGSQGLYGLSKIKSLGSTSRKVAESSPCPVLIIR
ncbi:MAG: universal stress protein [Candidatus Nitrosotenuis sp.]